MTTVFPTKYKCPVCGHVHETNVMGSTNAFGAPDLDGRPSPMARDTIYLHIKQCPHCLFASFGIPESTEITRDFVESENYRNCDGIQFKSSRAEPFYRVFMISRELGNPRKILFDLFNCAWVCDDDSDRENAIKFRIQINDLFNELYDFSDGNKQGTLLIKADFMRRAHLFDELIDELEDKTFEEPFYENLRKFQIEKAKEKDDAIYTCDDIEGYEEFYYG